MSSKGVTTVSAFLRVEEGEISDRLVSAKLPNICKCVTACFYSKVVSGRWKERNAMRGTEGSSGF